MASIKELGPKRQTGMVPKGVQIVVAAPKGGVGKTTLIMSLLVSARRAGLRVIGVNMDEQPTLKRWGDLRQRQREFSQDADIVDITIENVKIHDYRAARERFTEQYDLVIYDTPPGHEEVRDAIRALCDTAQMVLIPTSASDVDLDEVIPFRLRVAGDKGLFVLNNVNRRTRTYQRAKMNLVKHGKLCSVDIPRLDAISSQYKLGLASPDQPDVAGFDAFDALWDALVTELGIKVPARKAVAA